MIISPKYKFVFVLTEKTGCTSIFNVLENIDDTKKIVGEIVPKDHNNEHYSNKINSLSDSEKNINLNYNEVVWEAERSNLYKKVYFETLNKYHKNCLTIF